MVRNVDKLHRRWLCRALAMADQFAAQTKGQGSAGPVALRVKKVGASGSYNFSRTNSRQKRLWMLKVYFSFALKFPEIGCFLSSKFCIFSRKENFFQ